MNNRANRRYIKTCKKEYLIPIFAGVNVSLKDVNFNLRNKITSLIIEPEMQNNHLEKWKLKKRS